MRPLYSLFFWTFLALSLSACEYSRPPFKIDTVKYADVVARDAAGTGYLIQKRAIDAYEGGYFRAVNNRAFAQSASGSWAWSKDFTASEAAMDDALAKCRERNQANEAGQPCKIVNLNGYWMSRFYKEE